MLSSLGRCGYIVRRSLFVLAETLVLFNQVVFVNNIVHLLDFFELFLIEVI
jgi:hypothetical protein